MSAVPVSAGASSSATRELLIVSNERFDLYAVLHRAGLHGTEVRLDQRRRDRRFRARPVEQDRRRRDRRTHDIDGALRRVGWVIVPATDPA